MIEGAEVDEARNLESDRWRDEAGRLFLEEDLSSGMPSRIFSKPKKLIGNPKIE
jgi:hypothetical protein